MTQTWRDYLRQKKCIFSSYVQVLGNNDRTVFVYQNDGSSRERVIGIVLNQEGELFPGFTPFDAELEPKQTATIDVSKQFGSDLVTQWSSPLGSAQIGNAGYTNLNVVGEKEKKKLFLILHGSRGK
jgi:threonyl-tRNA synthetase